MVFVEPSDPSASSSTVSPVGHGSEMRTDEFPLVGQVWPPRSGSVAVTVDTDRIGQVLGNLLDNALRHTPAGGTVTVISGQVGRRHVEITVSDSGEGIAPHHLDHLFDRFYRADTSRGRHSGGSGIGLTITRALVEAHGGHIRAHSDGSGQGASFTVEIPKQD